MSQSANTSPHVTSELAKKGITMTQIPLVPQCPLCHQSLAYEGAPHAQSLEAITSDHCPHRLGFLPTDPVEYTVYCMYAQHPTLFGRSPWSRWHIFEQIFFVNGNEFKWQDGCLIDIYNGLPEIPPPLLSSMDVAKQHSSRWNTSRNNFSWEKVAREVEEEWSQYHRQPSEFYPLCEYADILRVPLTDVHPSWLFAALDGIRMFLHITGGGQSVREIYHLVRVYDALCTRIKLAEPDIDEPLMTRDLGQKGAIN